MQIVIDIPEQAYKLLQGEGVDWLGAEHILNTVANGTPLPKDHGDLIDRDALDLKAIDTANYGSNFIRMAKVIVKSTKGEE